VSYPHLALGLLQTIPCLANDTKYAVLTTLPTFKEVEQAVLNLSPTSSLGPNGFGGLFIKPVGQLYLKVCIVL